jgi:hypothetical protein
MSISSEEADLVKDILMPEEAVKFTATQRRVGPGGSITTPTTVICTNQRIIIVNRASLGIRKDYESIYYRQITSVRYESGIINASVFIRVQGYDRDKGLLKSGREEGEIDGLRKEEAKEMADYINNVLGGIEGVSQQTPIDQSQGSPTGGYIYCQQCGAQNSIDAKFCSKCGAKLR